MLPDKWGLSSHCQWRPTYKIDSTGFNVEVIVMFLLLEIQYNVGNTYRMPLPFWFSGKNGSHYRL